MAKWVFLNNAYMEEEKAFLHFKDLSFQRGYGIFDFFRLKRNSPLFLDDHLDRFYASAAGMHLPIQLKREELKQIISGLLERNAQPDSGVRLSLTGGYSDDGFNIGNPNLLLSQQKFSPPTVAQIEKGIKLMTYSYQRQLPHIKSIDYLMAIWLQPLKTKKGADDILYYNNGIVSECPRSNIFLLTRDDKIITPGKNVLQGITAKKVIQIAKQEFTLEERDITLEEVKNAREVFITSTTKQILPVTQIDDTVYPSTAISLRLLQKFNSLY